MYFSSIPAVRAISVTGCITQLWAISISDLYPNKMPPFSGNYEIFLSLSGALSEMMTEAMISVKPHISRTVTGSS